MSITEELLFKLSEAGSDSARNLKRALRKAYKSESVRITLSRLEKRGLVLKKMDKGEALVQLTDLGKEKLKKISSIKKLMPWQLEGKGERYCVVVFDIPERDRVLRDLLRRKLREAGFVGWQKSVWIGKNIDVPRLREFVNDLGLTKHVLAIETADLGSVEAEKVF